MKNKALIGVSVALILCVSFMCAVDVAEAGYSRHWGNTAEVPFDEQKDLGLRIYNPYSDAEADVEVVLSGEATEYVELETKDFVLEPDGSKLIYLSAEAPTQDQNVTEAVGEVEITYTTSNSSGTQIDMSNKVDLDLVFHEPQEQTDNGTDKNNSNGWFPWPGDNQDSGETIESGSGAWSTVFDAVYFVFLGALSYFIADFGEKNRLYARVILGLVALVWAIGLVAWYLI